MDEYHLVLDWVLRVEHYFVVFSSLDHEPFEGCYNSALLSIPFEKWLEDEMNLGQVYTKPT